MCASLSGIYIILQQGTAIPAGSDGFPVEGTSIWASYGCTFPLLAIINCNQIACKLLCVKTQKLSW